MKRKCSFRFLHARPGMPAEVVTQDARRRVNVVTGRYETSVALSYQSTARTVGASVIVRRKVRSFPDGFAVRFMVSTRTHHVITLDQFEGASEAKRARNELFNGSTTITHCWIERLYQGRTHRRWGFVLKRERTPELADFKGVTGDD